MASDYDVLIVGGGPAGLAAAMALGRMRRRTLVCDDGQPRNAASEHVNNFPSQDGVHPAAWRTQARTDLEKYETVHFHVGSVRKIAKDGLRFRAEVSSVEPLRFRKVILAFGVVDTLRPIPGLRELWGKSVFHCPYCHGFEVRDKRLGLIANGARAEHLAPMIHSLSHDVILFTAGQAELNAGFKAHLQRKNIPLVEEPIRWLDREEEQLRAVVLENGVVHEREALFLAPTVPYQGRSEIGERLGCEANEMGLYKVSPIGKTTVDGVFAAGDITTGQQSVLGAAATGQLAGAGVVSELLSEDFVLN
jgi:thioredoxin reductase